MAINKNDFFKEKNNWSEIINISSLYLKESNIL